MKISSKYTDDELIEQIRNDISKIEIVYRECKSYCINTMKKFCKSNIFYDDTQWLDIYHESINILLKNICKNEFSVKEASIKTFLTRICINQFKVNITKKSREISLITDDLVNKNNTPVFSVNEWLLNKEKIPTIKKGPYIENNNDNEDDNEYQEKMLNMLKKEFAKMKDLNSKCWEILNRYFFKKQSQDLIALEMNYANADTIKNLKSRCQKNLKEMLFNSNSN